MSAADVAAGLSETLAQPAYALIRQHDSDTVLMVGGYAEDHDLLRDVPLCSGPAPGDGAVDRLLCVPYAQVRERGFDAHADDTPLRSIVAETTLRIPVEDLLPQLPDETLDTVTAGRFDVDDTAYGDVVSRVIADEIGRGEGANLVVARSYRTRIADWSHRKALTVFGHLLKQERGAYWTFCVFTGDRFLIGASPERHVSVRGPDVAMNPISGTFRVGGYTDAAERKDALLSFLADEKEIFELFMVVDEELKMMCRICAEGGQIIGPFLKPMTHLMHTEYLLAGRSSADPRDILRDSMFAATVTGSPLQNACRLISAYESEGRGYYGSMLALLGRDGDGAATMDAPIVLRTADVGTDGTVRIMAGATLVRDSDPAYEVAETHAKAAGILTAFGLTPPAEAPAVEVSRLAEDEDVTVALARRNQRLAEYWLADQSAEHPHPTLAGKQVVVIDGEDGFTAMLAHMLRGLGMCTDIVSHADYRSGLLNGADVVVVGPGPGDPRDPTHPKIAAVRRAVDDLLGSGRPFLAVCLGHQVLCGALGLDLVYKDIAFQGTQARVELDGQEEDVGFYNTFVARVTESSSLPPGVSVERDEKSGDVHEVRGPHFAGIQFHAESILTQHGVDLVADRIARLLPSPS